MSDFRVVELTRTNEKGGKGTFGFSVGGGAGTKLPVIVWEVTPGLPADLSKEVHVGDILVSVNDRPLEDMTPSDVVEMITSSPQISSFVFAFDESIQNKVKRRKARQAAGRPKKEAASASERPKKESVVVEPSVNCDSDVQNKGSPSNRSLPTKGISKDFKRSFIKPKGASGKSRYRLSEGEDPLSSINDPPVLPRHSSSSSLDPPRGPYDFSYIPKHRSTSDSLRIGTDSSPEVARRWNERSPPNTKMWKEVSPRLRNALSPDPYSQRVRKAMSPDLFRARHSSDQWDSIASSQSESSVDILSGSCDSLDTVTTATTTTTTVSKNTSPPIRRGESSAVKVSSVDKKQVIKNLATITSLTQVDEGKCNIDDDKIKHDFLKDDHSPCGPDAKIICSQDLNDITSHDHTGVSHDATNVSHDSPTVSHDPPTVSHDPPTVSHDPPTVSHDPPTVSHDPATVSHDPTGVSQDLSNVSQDLNSASHDPASVSHDSTSVSHDPTNVSCDSNSVSHDPDDISVEDNNQSVSMDSNMSSQSIHVEFLDTSQHSLEDIVEEPSRSSSKELQDVSVQPTTSIQSIGEVILPIVTVNNAHHNTGVEHMIQVEIKQSKYGPHRFSNSSDEVTDSNSPSSAAHHQDNDVSSDDNATTTRKLSSSHLRVKRTESGRPPRALDSREEAVMLARKLFMLDGYRRSQIAGHLSDKSEFGKNVAEEYLKFFDFENISLDQALRQFVCSFILSGETHEQERIIQHFSHRFHKSNPDMFATADSCHSLICALLLLNTDLHAEHTGSRMTQSQFISNLQGTGEHYPKELLKGLYDSIKKTPLPLAIDEKVTDTSSSTQNGTGSHGNGSKEPPSSVPVYHVTFPGTFIEVDLAGDAPVFKEGEIFRKNVMEAPNKKVPSGKRKWKPFYAYLKGFLLYFIEPQQEMHLSKTSNALPITHCIAQRAYDYHKRSSVIRVTTSDWKVFLLQAPSVTEMQQWMSAINKASGTYSSTPLAAPIGSSSHFQRPMLPLAPTRLSQEDQIESHNGRIKSLEKELEEHRAYHSGNVNRKGKSNQGWLEKLEYLEFELTRYRIYVACMTSTSIEELQTRYIPSSLVPSPSVSTLATMQIDEMTYQNDPPSPTLSTQSHLALDIKHHKRKGLFHRK